MINSLQKHKSLGFNLIIALLIIAIGINILFVLESNGQLFDFGSFIASGQLDREGKNPYSTDSSMIFNVQFGESGIGGKAPNLNPPISVLIFRSISNIKPTTSISVWRILTVGFFLMTLIFLNHIYPAKGLHSILRTVWALSLAGFWHTLQLGQVYCFLLLLTLLTWLMLKDQKKIVAGIFLGLLIAVKPNFVFWAVLLLIAGNWRCFISAGFTSLVVSTIPILTNGFYIYKEWLDASASNTPHLLLFPGNNSIQGLTARFGSADTGVVLSVFLAGLVIFMVIKNKPNESVVNSLGIITSLLISPIAWTGYTLLTLPIFYEKKIWNWQHILSACIFSIPFIVPLSLFTTSIFNMVLFGWFYGWGLLILLVEFILGTALANDKKPAITNIIQTN